MGDRAPGYAKTLDISLPAKAGLICDGVIMSNAHGPIHPGEVVLEEFLRALGISQYRLARAIGVPPRRINEIVHRKRSISPDTALRLSRAFGTSDRFWMNLQTRYDLDVQLMAHRKELDKIEPLVA